MRRCCIRRRSAEVTSNQFFTQFRKNEVLQRRLQRTVCGATFRNHEALPEAVRVEVVGSPGGEEDT